MVLRGVWWLLLILPIFGTPARAQVSGSVTLLSDDRYDGMSLSDGKPAAQLALAWDRDDGWYAGVQLTGVRLPNTYVKRTYFKGASSTGTSSKGLYPEVARFRPELQSVPYLGYVRVLRNGWSADAGVQYTTFSRSHEYDYPEIYAGLAGERLSVRVSLMPHYFGQATALYANLDGNHPLRGRLRALAHVGALHADSAVNRDSERERQRWRYDMSIGLGWPVAGFDVQTTWTTTRGAGSSLNDPGGAACVPYQCGARSAWVLRLTRSW